MISFTENGDYVNQRVAALLPQAELHQCGKKFRRRTETLSEWTAKAFCDDAVIFIGAAGIAVRAIAPYIKGKDVDPAVLVIDEKAQYVIPILSGHIGGANALASRIAQGLGAAAIITTATDLNQVWAVDTWAVNNGYAIADISEIKHLSAALLGDEKVGFVSDFPVFGNMPEGVEPGCGYECGICISDEIKKPFTHTVNLIPKRYVIGVGSKKDADENALTELFETMGIHKESVAGVATIDIKKDEKSVLRLCEYLGAELTLYTADELNAVSGDFTPSAFVKNITGTDNVCERSAMVWGGELIKKKTKGRGVTMAAARMDWSVSF